MTEVLADQLNFDRLSADVRRDIRKLCTLDDYHGPLAILFEFGLIAVSVLACTEVSYWFYPASILVIGSTHRFLAHFLHESSHKSFMRNSRLNLLAGTLLSGYLILQLYGPYRTTHVGSHHRSLGDAKDDPDYRFHIECGLYDPQRTSRRFFAKEVLLSAVGVRAPQYLRYVIRERFFCDESQLQRISTPISLRTERIVFALEWLAIIGTCAWFGLLTQLVLFWFVPMFTTGAAIGWLSELAEHYPMPESESKSILLTRNRHGRWLERFLLSRHNDRFHLIHHLNAGIPFWRLKQAHQIMLRDPAYAAWDGVWAGLFTRPAARSGKETVLSYAAKYRRWRQRGGDPAQAQTTFAELMMIARAQGADEPVQPPTADLLSVPALAA